MEQYSRRKFLSVSAFGLAAAAFAIACGDDDEEPSASGASGASQDDPNRKKLIAGWYRGRTVRYYDFGGQTKLAQGSSVISAPIYVMSRGVKADGSPDLVPGQNNIVDVKPGDQGYSDLWQVMVVTAPAGYQANAIKSRSEIMAQGLTVTPTSMFVNCPIVPAGATLEGGEKLVQGWYKGSSVFYPDFGPNQPVAVPIWAFATGIDAGGMPRLVEGQQNVIDLVPNDASYSALWRVNLVMVPSSYRANAIKSAEDVRASGYQVTQTDMVVNCPVVSVA